MAGPLGPAAPLRDGRLRSGADHHGGDDGGHHLRGPPEAASLRIKNLGVSTLARVGEPTAPNARVLGEIGLTFLLSGGVSSVNYSIHKLLDAPGMRSVPGVRPAPSRRLGYLRSTQYRSGAM